MVSNPAGRPLQLQNVLAQSASPYLRSHKDNPIAWQGWFPETIELAKQHERLIFLSIGFASCHWCHVMDRESFTSPEVAKYLNDNFIPIILDRESRPDLDDIYMNFVTATTGAGGWPLNVFLTPDLKPVFGGTYWPGPSTSTGQASQQSTQSHVTFLEILHKIQDIWTSQRERCLQASAEITTQLREFSAEGTHSHSSVQIQGGAPASIEAPEPLELDLFDDALEHFISRYDPVHGGFGLTPTSPKFPTPANLAFLLRIGAAVATPSTNTRFGFFAPVSDILGHSSCVTAATMALHTLLAMSRSGLRDQLGYGFHRYSVTPDWNLPHFEKMMCDNAQLLGVYCDAWALGRNPEILGVIYNLVEYFTNPSSPIVHPAGGWYASEDSDSSTRPHLTTNGTTDHDSKEGAHYVWTLKEFQSILGDTAAPILARHFGVKADGNVPTEHDVNDEFLNQNVLSIQATPSVLSKEFGIPEDEIVRIIKNGRAQLQAYRKSQRSAPQVDNKIIASWNGLAISALSRAANTLATIDKARAARCAAAAEKAAHFIRSEMFNPATGEVTRVYKAQGVVQGREYGTAFVDDYAYLTLGSLALYDLNLNPQYLEWAATLQTYQDTHFLATPPAPPAELTSQGGAGYYQASGSLNQVLRLKPGADTGLPSPNGITAQNLLYLSSYAPQNAEIYTLRAKSVLDAFAVEIIQHPFLYVNMLAALVIEQVGVKRLIAPKGMREREVRKLKGFGRTLIRGDVSAVMIVTKSGEVRELRDSDLNDVDDDNADDAFVTAASAAISSGVTSGSPPVVGKGLTTA
ncbi:hypothetical protein B0A52_03194 [Exophiala mesophila]|uniref:Spermatogenesis-associated protein 20-like TRX domain-containing protein n=1 Tax=Exophiala mesophila TaxID=212818 RepID=A0A438NAP0_EXOME|nr:hypothetical protein B0A52_03194 [Exophiala mesophila]